MTGWSRERALDEMGRELDIGQYDTRCPNCGALYYSHPEYCALCGSADLEPADDQVPW